MPQNDVFFDTNVVVYFASEHGAKAKQSASLLAGRGVVSVQVLNEFANVALGKRQMSFASVRTVLAAVRSVCDVVPLTLEIHDSAVRIAERYQFGIYDASIVAAALSEGCTTLFSEDMQHGQVIDGLTIVNPYR